MSEPLDRAMASLEGLSVGDAFGDRFFVAPEMFEALVYERALPAPPWRFTDDTNMALSLVDVLRRSGAIDQDQLALDFAERYDPSRGYGPAMHGMLRRVREGEHWRDVSQSLFAGQGSYGNGAAMRAAPVGAYFAHDLAMAVEHARRSAEVTHSHEEGIAGAIAVAVAAACAWRLRDARTTISAANFLDNVLLQVPESKVRRKLVRARDFRPDLSVEHAAAMLGSGQLIAAHDTVPFALWCAAHHLDNYEEALWTTLRGGGDRDTTCAIVGGIVVLATGVEGIPAEWRSSREPLV